MVDAKQPRSQAPSIASRTSPPRLEQLTTNTNLGTDQLVLTDNLHYLGIEYLADVRAGGKPTRERIRAAEIV